MSDFLSKQNSFMLHPVSVTGVTMDSHKDNTVAFPSPQCQLEPKKFWKILTQIVILNTPS